jgi:tight adherence protein B
VVMAIRVQHEVGGNLAELLTTVAVTLRERDRLRRQVRALSAEGRLSGWILGGLPVVFAIYLSLVRPEYLSPLVHTPLGWLLLAVAAVLYLTGAIWMSRVVRVEV